LGVQILKFKKSRLVRLFLFHNFAGMITAKQISSGFLIPIILWAGMGFSLNRHYCLGTLVEESWYHATDECQPNHNDRKETCGEGIEPFGSCCSDLWITIEALTVNSQLEKDVTFPLGSLKSNKTSLFNSSLFQTVQDVHPWHKLVDNSSSCSKNRIFIRYQHFLI
jgi:hypothetical protein